MVGRQPHAPAAFTPRRIRGTHFLEVELTPGHMVLSVSTRKIPVTDATGIRSRDRPTSSTVPYGKLSAIRKIMFHFLAILKSVTEILILPNFNFFSASIFLIVFTLMQSIFLLRKNGGI